MELTCIHMNSFPSEDICNDNTASMGMTLGGNQNINT